MKNKNAKFSDDGKYRFWLRRPLLDEKKEKPVCVFVMLNPSVADGEKNDPTISQCQNYATNWKFKSLEVVNLFALVEPDSKKIRKNNEKLCRPENKKTNDKNILEAAQKAGLVVAAWGNRGKVKNRSFEVKKLLRENGINVKALVINKSGEPHHPLYLKKDLKLKDLKNLI